jgi:uncharacterized protein (TIGR02246 family)
MENTGTVLQKDVSAIRTIYSQLIDSWNEMNGEAYAALFTADGSIVGFDGSQANGRKEIYDHLSAIFADHAPARYVTLIREVRLLSPSVGLLRAVAGMVPRNEKEINPKTNAIQSLVAVKQEQRFMIAHFQNTPAAFHGRTEDAMKLTKELQGQFQKDHKEDS